MQELLIRFGRLLGRGFGVSVTLCVSMVALAQPNPTPGLARTWLADEYTLDAQFKLQLGRVVVWKPLGGAAPGSLVEFEGVLDEESTRVLGVLLKEGRMHTLSMAGPGGLVAPTLKLGRALRTMGVTTVVEAGRRCYSACALLFLAGEVRIVNDEPMGLPGVVAEVGFHAPYIIGNDGFARHLQEVKTSSSCAYIKQLLPQPVATELCAYTLATKGMATFSLHEGKRLHIYTSSEAEELKRIADSLVGEPSADEQQWIECERERLHSEREKLSVERRIKSTDAARLEPCAAWRTPPAPGSPIRRADLFKAARALGPQKTTLEMYQRARREVSSRLMQAGLTAGEQRRLDCLRAFQWLTEQNKQPTGFNTSNYSSEFVTWQRACQFSILLVKPRNLEGIGQLSDYEVHTLLDILVKDQGPRWPPPYPQ